MRIVYTMKLLDLSVQDLTCADNLPQRIRSSEN